MGYDGRRRRILVADDQEENRELLRQMLEPLGFDVALAGDGREALDLRRALPSGPGADGPAHAGHERLRRRAAIRALPGLEAVPIIAASASSADLARAEADPATFARSLRKPFQTEDLLEAIERMLGLHLALRQGSEEAIVPARAPAVVPVRAAIAADAGRAPRPGTAGQARARGAGRRRISSGAMPGCARSPAGCSSWRVASRRNSWPRCCRSCLETAQDAVSH